VGEAQSGKARFEKAIDAQAGFVGADSDALNADCRLIVRLYLFSLILGWAPKAPRGG